MSEKGKAPEPDMENTIRAEAPDTDAGRPGDVPAVTETMDVQMLASLLMDPGSALDIPRPYAREIYLFDTYVAGTRYAPDIEKLERELKEGETLFFVREPENPYDELAIRVQTMDGAKVGYVPRANLENRINLEGRP